MKKEALTLAKQLDSMESAYTECIEASAMIRRLVEELDKQGEPVAWSCWNDDMPSAIITFTEPDKHGWMSIKPLYTTPQTKPLSDDEIIDIWFTIPNGTLKARTIDFARLIEERHGIK